MGHLEGLHLYGITDDAGTVLYGAFISFESMMERARAILAGEGRSVTTTKPEASTETVTPVQPERLYTWAQVKGMVANHCNWPWPRYDWWPQHSYRNGVWRVSWTNTRSGKHEVTLNENTSAFLVVSGCSAGR